MYGNVITNRQFKKLKYDGCIDIRPFSDSRLKESAYTLSPGRVLRMSVDGEWEQVFAFGPKKTSFTLEAGEYVLVEPREMVSILVNGVVGSFIQTSTNVESGLLVVAGQIDNKYGLNNEALRFGIKNLLDRENAITTVTRLVHLQLIDMRGSTADPAIQSAEMGRVIANRRRDPRFERDDSDGPSHDPSAYD